MTSTQHTEISLNGAVVPGRLEEIAERASTGGPWTVHVDTPDGGWSQPISGWDTNRDAVHEAIRLGRTIGCRVAISRTVETTAR